MSRTAWFGIWVTALGLCTALGVGTAIGEPTRFGLHAAGTDRDLIVNTGAGARRQIRHWYDLQPSADQFNFDITDRLVTGTSNAGIEMVMTLRTNSQWATEVPITPGAFNFDQPDSPPKNMDDWRNYVSTLVERYDGDGIDDVAGLGDVPVKHWQLGNEFLAQWEGTEEEMIELMAVTYDAVKSADPEAMVITPGLTATNIFSLRDGFNSNGWIYRGDDGNKRLVTADDLPTVIPEYDFTKRLLSEGSDYYDIVDVHLYISSPEEAEFTLNWLQHQFAEQGLDKRIWSTEFAAPFFDWTEQEFSRSVITTQVTAFGHGMDRIYWSSLMPTLGWPDSFLRLALVDLNGQETAAYQVYGLLTEQIEGFVGAREVDADLGSKSYEFTFADESTTVISWDDEGIDFRTPTESFRLENSILGLENADCSADGVIDLADADCTSSTAINGFLRLYGYLPGDADGDGRVGFPDFLALSSNFGTEANYSGGDFDRDGTVGFLDFLTLSNNFGATNVAAATAAVPEPGGQVLMFAALVLLGAVTRRQARTIC